MPKIRQQASTENFGKPEKCCYMTRSRVRKIIEGDLSVGQVRTGVKNGGSAASHRPQSSSSVKVCKNVRFQDNSSKKGHTGSRMLKKNPGVPDKAVRNGERLNGTAVPRLSTTMPKLLRSPAIISRPVQATASEPSLETRALQVVTSDHERRLQRLEDYFKVIQHHVTDVVPAQLDTILVHADRLIDTLREQFVQDFEYLRDRMNHLNRAQQQRPNNLRISIS